MGLITTLRVHFLLVSLRVALFESAYREVSWTRLLEMAQLDELPIILFASIIGDLFIAKPYHKKVE